jgi:hypothetical protein
MKKEGIYNKMGKVISARSASIGNPKYIISQHFQITKKKGEKEVPLLFTAQ